MLPLSQDLRESTRQEHQSAEMSPFISGLMRGSLTLADYTRYLINMAWLYEALEKKFTLGAPLPGSEALWDERLLRIASITSDLENLGVHEWRDTSEPSSAMASYIAHLDSMTGRDDPRLIAHHYTRYLGDLSGGQAIAALVRRHYGASSDQLSFYRFEGIDNVVRFKETYRQILDGIQLNTEEHRTVVDEAKSAFVRNQRVFDDLQLESQNA